MRWGAVRWDGMGWHGMAWDETCRVAFLARAVVFLFVYIIRYELS